MIDEFYITSFVSLVDEASARAPRYVTLGEGISSLGLETSPDQGTRGLQDEIWKRIEQEITDEHGRPIGDLRGLSRALFRRAWSSPQLDHYPETVRCLLYGAAATWRFREFSDREPWITVIKLLECLRLIPGASFDLNSLIGMEREIAVMSSIKRLQDRGYRFHHDGERTNFDEGELERCCNEFHGLFRQANGQRVITSLFQFLLHHNTFRAGRFIVGRTSRPVYGFNADPAIPYGYLINASFRHLHQERPTSNPQKIVGEILRFATDIAAALDFETYSPYVHMFGTHESLPKYLQEIILADHILTFRQIVPAHALEIIRGVFRWVDNAAMREHLGWDIGDAIALAEHVLMSIPGNVASFVVDQGGLRTSGLGSQILNKMMDYFAHDSREVNKDYLTPLDAMKADCGFKPLVAQPGGRYFALPPSLCSIAFYEVIATALRDVFGSKNVEQKIGDAIEPMVEAAFVNRGIRPSAVSKKYAMAGEDGECDIVLETQNAVIFIELKKKSMTRQALAGDTLKGFLDLFGGVLNTQVQLGRHEALLLENGHIEFLDKSRIELSGRRIERLAVTLLDWGGTQDRAVLRQIAQLMVTSTISSSLATAAQLESLAKANETLEELGKQAGRLASLGIDARNQYSNWWFMSVPQLLFLLADAHDADDFYENLSKVKYITTGVLDLYQEFVHMTQVQAAAAATSVS